MRSAEAHARLVAHDTALPGLSALLDDVVLSERLGAPSTRTYLRYKTGTNATALVDVAGRPAIANAWPAGGGAKRAKALKDVAAADVLLDAPEDGLLVVDAMADRRLPALRRLVHTGRIGPWLAERGHPVDPHARPRTLAHKPGRRWVGSIPLTGHRAGEHVVLRAYTVDEFDAALAAHELAVGQVERPPASTPSPGDAGLGVVAQDQTGRLGVHLRRRVRPELLHEPERLDDRHASS